MKLLTKISRYYILNSAILFIAAFVAIFLALNWMINEEIDEQLLLSQSEIKGKIRDGIIVNNPPFIEVTEVPQKVNDETALTDTSIYINSEESAEPFRQSVSYFENNGKNFKLIVRTSIIEKEDLLLSLLLIFAFIFSLMVIILYFINRKAAKEIFKPFYENLNRLKKYSVKSGSGIEIKQSNIDEFAELNNALKELSVKAGKEYKLLKEFTEDLSHELQTPVSVVKTKLELMLQKEFADEETIDYIRKAYRNINKLDKLNKSLVLLSKLESEEFFDSTQVSLKRLVERVLVNFTDIAEVRNIKINADVKSERQIRANETLLDILISNLLSNSIKHNYNNGKIFVELKENVLRIKNTSHSGELKSEDVFNRFKKKSNSNESIGLGLAIVKKICSLYNYEVQYFFKFDMHIIEVKFE